MLGFFLQTNTDTDKLPWVVTAIISTAGKIILSLLCIIISVVLVLLSIVYCSKSKQVKYLPLEKTCTEMIELGNNLNQEFS